jgi:hypothetical protein
MSLRTIWTIFGFQRSRVRAADAQRDQGRYRKERDRDGDLVLARAASDGVLGVACGPLLEPPDRCRVHVIGPRDVGLRLAGVEPPQGFPALMRSELARAAEFDAAARLRPSPVLARISSRSNSAKPPKSSASDGQPIEPRHDPHIALVQPPKWLRQLGAIGFGSGSLFQSCRQSGWGFSVS